METRLQIENSSPSFYFTIGSGFNSFTSTPLNDSPFTFDETKEGISASETQATVCFNQSELNNALGVDVHGTATVNALSTIGMSAKIHSSYDSSKQFMTIVTRVIVKSRRRTANNPVLKPEANFTQSTSSSNNVTPSSTPTSSTTVSVSTPESFFLRYGDRFCKEIIYGAKLVMMFKFHNVLKQSSSSSKLSFSLNFLKKSDTNVQLKDLGRMIESLSSQYFMTMEWRSYGGPMLEDADASDVVAFCDKFASQVNETNDVPVEVCLIPYSDLRTFIPTTFDDCRNNLPLYLNNAKTLRNLLVGDSLGDEIEQKVRGEYDSLLTDINTIVTAYTKLFPSEFSDFAALGLKSPEEYAMEIRKLLKSDQPDGLQNGHLFALSYHKELHGKNLWYIGSSIPSHFTHICDKWAATVRYRQKINLRVELIEGNDNKSIINIASTERCTENSPFLYHDLNILDGLVWSSDRLDRRAQWVVVPKSKVPKEDILKFGQIVFIKNRHTKKYLAPRDFHGLFVLNTDSTPHAWIISRPRYIRQD